MDNNNSAKIQQKFIADYYFNLSPVGEVNLNKSLEYDDTTDEPLIQKIKIGNIDASKIYLGSFEIKRLYLGNQTVYSVE